MVQGNGTPLGTDERLVLMAGGSAEEAGRIGQLGRLEVSVDHMFPEGKRLADSPIYRLLWDGPSPDIIRALRYRPFQPRPQVSHAIQNCLGIAARWRGDDPDRLSDPTTGKLDENLLIELQQAGYFGLLVPEPHGLGASLREFTSLERQMSALDYCLAILGSVHGGIGAVSPVRRFGSAWQQAEWLPQLAHSKLSGFALTEPWAGSDTQSCKLTGTIDGDDVVVHGEKLFITNVVPGCETRLKRMVSLVLKIDGKFCVAVVEIPEKETPEFNLGERYRLRALKRLENHRLVFNGFRFPKKNLLPLPEGADGRVIALWCLAIGRVSLAALSDGAIGYLVANIPPWARKRETFKRPLAERDQIQVMTGEVAALNLIAYCMTDLAATLFDDGRQIELEAAQAKVIATDCVTRALRLFKIIHGGRSAHVAHPYTRLADEIALMEIYEGANGPLRLNWLKALLKLHGEKTIFPLVKALQDAGILDEGGGIHFWKLFQPSRWQELWAVAWPYLQFKYARLLHPGRSTRSLLAGVPQLPRALREHVQYALSKLQTTRGQILGALERLGKDFYNQQSQVDLLARKAQELICMLVVALRAGEQDPRLHIAADAACRMLRYQVEGRHPSRDDFAAKAALGRQVLAGDFPLAAGIRPDPIVLDY